jgi:dTDP-D-glucose 4,6-dehydratase
VEDRKKSKQNKPKIIITGGLGFIFSYVTEFYIRKGYKVFVLDNQSEGSHPEIIDGSFQFCKIDVSKLAVINLIQDIHPEYVIHAAAISDVDYSISHPYKTLASNIMANLNVFEACRTLPNLKKLIYVSTDEVYGECEVKKTENDIIFPKNPYSCSKAVGSLIRLSYDNTYKELRDKTAETRFCNIFGARQDKRKIFPAIKESLFGDYEIPVHNEGTGFREYLHVENIPEVIDLILEKGNRTYNVTLNDMFSVNQLIAYAEQITGRKVKTRPAMREGMDSKYQMDNSRIMELGWRPKLTFEQGVKKYLCQK